jgi:cupin 2 domain-containing protein
MSLPEIRHLFAPATPLQGAEIFETLVEQPMFRLERIVSNKSVNPPGFWLDQRVSEWVLLARGEAALCFEGAEPFTLKAGDHLLIPARQKHRVESTSDDAVWLALHFKG